MGEHAGALITMAEVQVLQHEPATRRKRPSRPECAPKRPARGEAHGRARLSDAQVVSLRKVFVSWRRQDAELPPNTRRGYVLLALRFGCGWATARDIVKGRTRLDAGGPIMEESDDP